jgi:hypothetical protein
MIHIQRILLQWRARENLRKSAVENLRYAGTASFLSQFLRSKVKDTEWGCVPFVAGDIQEAQVSHSSAKNV